MLLLPENQEKQSRFKSQRIKEINQTVQQRAFSSKSIYEGRGSQDPVGSEISRNLDILFLIWEGNEKEITFSEEITLKKKEFENVWS